MNKTSIIATVAMAAAGIATYLIRKAVCERKRKNQRPLTTGHSRHLTDVFSKAKLAAN